MHLGNHPLENFDSDWANRLMTSVRDVQIDIHTEVEVTARPLASIGAIGYLYDEDTVRLEIEPSYPARSGNLKAT